MNCLRIPYPFASDHARVLFFRDETRHPAAPAYVDFRADVVLMSGLPGSGKDHHIRTHLPDWPVISLDEIRREMDIDPADDQGRVVSAARDRAKMYLRQGQRFVWNGTNISRQLRGQSLDLLHHYQAQVRVIYLEVPPDVLFAQNRQREARVPEKVMHRLIDRWEVPDVTEAHVVEYRVR